MGKAHKELGSCGCTQRENPISPTSILNGTACGLSNKIVSIPCSTSLTKYQQDRVIVSIKKWSKIE